MKPCPGGLPVFGQRWRARQHGAGKAGTAQSSAISASPAPACNGYCCHNRIRMLPSFNETRRLAYCGIAALPPRSRRRLTNHRPRFIVCVQIISPQGWPGNPMKPAPFVRHVPRTLDEVLGPAVAAGGAGRPHSGGRPEPGADHGVPARRPAHLIDINEVDGLDRLHSDGKTLSIGGAGAARRISPGRSAIIHWAPC